MLLNLLFGIPTAVIGWFCSFFNNDGFNLAVTEGFRLIFGYGVYLMGDTTFFILTSCILFWTTLQFTISLVKFVIWLCPFIG